MLLSLVGVTGVVHPWCGCDVGVGVLVLVLGRCPLWWWCSFVGFGMIRKVIVVFILVVFVCDGMAVVVGVSLVAYVVGLSMRLSMHVQPFPPLLPWLFWFPLSDQP